MKFDLLLACCGTAFSLLSSCGTTAVIKPDTLIMVKDIDIPSSEALIAHFATHTFWSIGRLWIHRGIGLKYLILRAVQTVI